MAYSVYSYPSFYTATGMLTIYAGISPQNTDAVLKMIDEEIKALIEGGVTREEFEQTRAQIKGGYVLGQESASARMNALGRRMLLLGDTQSEDEMIRKLDAIDFDRVNEVMRQVLSAPRSAAFVGSKG